MEWQKVVVLVGIAIIVFGCAAMVGARIPAFLVWMKSHREYASLIMIVSVHGFSLCWCWVVWRHWELGWSWHKALFGN